MERSQYIIDRALYTDDQIGRAAHRYTGQFGVELQIHGSNIAVIFWSLDGSELPEHLWAKFSRDLLDERLRAAIRTETAGLQQELLRAALTHAQPVATHVEI